MSVLLSHEIEIVIIIEPESSTWTINACIEGTVAVVVGELTAAAAGNVVIIL